jgi:hypothetical protein
MRPEPRVSSPSVAKAAIERWRSEAPFNRFMRYVPGEVAARFLLPLCVGEWGYPLEQFYDPKAVKDAEIETTSGFQNHTLREELWASLNRGESLALNDRLIILFQRGSLYAEDFAAEFARAAQLSRQNPRSAVAMTTFERTDVLVDGQLARQYGLRDWENRFEEIRRIFDSESGEAPRQHSEAEEESRLEDALREMFQPLSEAFRSSEVAQVLKKNHAKEDVGVRAVQTLGYLLLLRAAEETYPFERTFLRRIHWAYSGDGREAYGDVTLTGAMWPDVNRLIRGMAEAPILNPYLRYKFPDAALRHRLWSIGGKIADDMVQAVLEPLVSERFGLLRAIHFGPVLGRLLKQVREDGRATSASAEQSGLWVEDGGRETYLSIAELRAVLEEAVDNRVKPAFKKRDAEAIRKVAEWAFQLRVQERHAGGPILVAQAADALARFHAHLHTAQDEMRTEMQYSAGNLFAEEDVGTLGSSISPDRSADDGGPYWALCANGILSGAYSTPEDAELAELSLNILNMLHADRSARHPKLVSAANLRHYVGRFLTAPGVFSKPFPIDDRPSSKLADDPQNDTAP